MEKSDIITRLPTAEELTPEILKSNELPPLPESMVKEISDAYKEAFALEDPKARDTMLSKIKHGEEKVKKFYSIPEDTKYTLGDAAMNVASLFSASELPKRVAAIPLGYNPLDTAPPASQIAREYGSPEGPTYGDIAPSEETLKNIESYMAPATSFGIAPKVFSKEGPLKNLSTLDILGVAADVGPDFGATKYSAAALLGKGGKGVAAKYPKVAAAAESIKNVLGEPIKASSEKLRQLLVKTPKADELARKAGKGEAAVTQIVDEYNIWGNTKDAVRKYEKVQDDAGREAADIIKRAEAAGKEALMLEGNAGRTDILPYIDMRQVTAPARKRIAKQMQIAGEPRQEALEALEYLDYLEGKVDLPKVPDALTKPPKKVLSPRVEVSGLGPIAPPKLEDPNAIKWASQESQDALEKLLKEDKQAQSLRGALEMIPGEGDKLIPAYKLSKAQELKQYLQRKNSSRYKTTAKPRSSIQQEVEMDVAEALKESLENKTGILLPEEAGNLKRKNHIYGTLDAGYEGFRKDMDPRLSMGDTLLQIGGPAMLGLGRSIQTGSPGPAILGGIVGGTVGAVRGTALGRTGTAQALKKSQKIPLDSMMRSGINEYINPNPYEELVRQQEKAKKENRSTK